MSEGNTKIPQMRNVFAKVAKGELIPKNFGNCLLRAASEGLSTKENIANILGTTAGDIRRVGNTLKNREIMSVSRQLAALENNEGP